MSVRVAKRYATSLFELAIEQKDLEKIEQGIVLLDKVCKENRPLTVLLKNPVIKPDNKRNILKKIFEGKVEPVVMRFMELACRKNRADNLPEMASAFIDLYNEYKGNVTAKLASAIPISDDLRKALISVLEKETNKNIILKETVDKSLIGGFVLKIGDNQIDNTLSSKLNALRRELTERK